MIVKIIPSPANKSFGAVSYNTNKIDRQKGELMKVANFGPLQGFSNLRPKDYINYLQALSNQNNQVKKPQFHVVISAKHKLYDKSSLTVIAEDWMKEMGYSSQPYLIVFHKDTGHNHVHIVSTRINKEGRKINSAWENVRAQKSIQKVLGYEFAFQYQFSTRAQFLMLLENQGYSGRDPDEQRVLERMAEYAPDKARESMLKEVFMRLKGSVDFSSILKSEYAIDLVFHSVEGKIPYGYSIIDHECKRVFKGSEVMPLKELLNVATGRAASERVPEPTEEPVSSAYIQSIRISDDVDDQQVHGMRRRRQKKVRTNTR